MLLKKKKSQMLKSKKMLTLSPLKTLWLISLRILILCLMLKLWLVIFPLLLVKVNLRTLVKADLTCLKLEKEKDQRKRALKAVLANQKPTDKPLTSTAAAFLDP